LASHVVSVRWSQSREVETLVLKWVIVKGRNLEHGDPTVRTDGVAETSLSSALPVDCVAKGLKYSGRSLLNFSEVNGVKRHLFCWYCSVTLPIASS
jgi:hypothetical protein